MKKIFAVLLVLVMMLSLVACGQDAKADKVAAYVADNRAYLLAGMEQSFAGSSGLTCTSDIKADGCGIVIDININELDNVDPALKEQLQAMYDAMGKQFDLAFIQLQDELPELEFLTINVNEVDGDNIASIKAN